MALSFTWPAATDRELDGRLQFKSPKDLRTTNSYEKRLSGH